MLSSFWDSFLSSVEEKIKSNPIFLSVMQNAVVLEMKEGLIVVGVTNKGAKTYLDGKSEVLGVYLTQHVGSKTQIEVRIIEQKQQKNAPLLSFEPSREDLYRRVGLNLNSTFENYAVSPTNQVAFAAAQAVAKSPGTSYNPLFLYGGVGVGKTHLAQSIARTILEQSPETEVFFCSSEKFMNELIESIRGKTTARFRKKYRSLRLIILDDVQFLAGKQTVQEEFFHTFNSIVSSGGQVVLTSDRPPFEIKNLEDRLRSRFSGGLLVDIQQPDFELRTAILLIKSREKNILLDIGAAKAIAEMVHDTRSLEGTLLSLYAKTLPNEGVEIDISLVEEFFQSKTQRTQTRVSPQDIVRAVCTFYNIKLSHLKGPTRKSTISKARQIVMYLLRTELNLNLEEVAYIVKRKDHTTVMHAVQKVKEQLMKDVGFQKEIQMILSSFHAST